MRCQKTFGIFFFNKELQI